MRMSLAEIISAIWREGNKMPKITRQKPLEPKTAPFQLNGDILGSGVSASELGNTKINAALYGRNGVGKTTFACQGEGPIALLAIDPSPTGGARSVLRPDVTVFYIAAKYLEHWTPDSKIVKETVKGSEKILAIVDAIRARYARGECPFRKIVVDGLTSWNDILLSEVLGEEYDNMPAILGWGKVSRDQYTERTERMIRYLRPILDLPCDVWLLSQERDHNPPKEVDEKGKMRAVQSKFMADSHPMSQEGSFFSLAVGDSAAFWVQNACDYIMQLYEDNEWREEKLPDVNMNGTIVPGGVQVVPTGRRVKRLRCMYHPNYAGRFRGDYRIIPEFIEAPTPEERYQAFLDVVAGRRTKFGHYPPAPAPGQ